MAREKIYSLLSHFSQFVSAPHLAAAVACFSGAAIKKRTMPLCCSVCVPFVLLVDF